jgi:chromosome partitioning protein
MIDLDPQGNATTGCGVVKREALPTVYQILIGRSTLVDARIKTEFGFDILPANRELAGAEVELIEMGGREYRLRDALAPVLGDYDFILMDCPPALNMLTVNGLVAARSGDDSDAVRVLRAGRLDRPRRHAEEGAGQSQSAAGNRGVAAYPLRSALDADPAGVGGTRRALRRKVYRTIIPRNVRLAEAPSYGKPVIAFDRSSKGAQAYMRPGAGNARPPRRRRRQARRTRSQA